MQSARKALRGEWGRLACRERAAHLHQSCRCDRKAIRLLCCGRGRGYRKADRSGFAARRPARGSEFPRLRRLHQDVGPGVISDGNSGRQERAELCRAQAFGRGGNHHSLESSALVADVESRTCAGMRKHGGRQAFGRDSCDGDAAGRSRCKKREFRMAFTTWCMDSGRSSAGEFLTQHPDVNAVTFTGESQPVRRS